ncbi:hypothetical protein [Brevundimonas sp. Marseille-Q4549]
MTLHSLTICASVSVLAAALTGVASPAQAQVERGVLYRDAPAMNAVIHNRVKPQMAALLDQLTTDGRNMTLDDIKVFEANDKFLPGKIAIGMAEAILDTPAEDARRAQLLGGFRRLSELMVEDDNETWGIYYYLSALHQLQQAGLLDQAVAPDTLERLRQRLDWRTFVRPDELTLINLPNNYFGVAFSIARLRYLLGWEDSSASEALLVKTLDHFRQYSGEFGFADETDGEGRFDRYSVLLIGEIAQRFIETGVQPPQAVKDWLRRSVDLLMLRFNLRGEGFEYGRSIGVYGETSFLEVLSAAAALDLLSDQEKAMAYAFSSRVAARYADFWLDSGTGSVNMWDHGRRTDAYRGKHRILGENISLSHQLFYTNAIWNRLGWKDRAPDPGFAQWLDTLPRSTTTWFARGNTDRALITYRDADRVIGLPLVNGGPTQHMNNPYFPIPYSPGVLAGAADQTYPQLIPRITLSDGTVLQPLSWFQDVQTTTEGDVTRVTYRLAALDQMGKASPVRDDRVSMTTDYVFSPSKITRHDIAVPRSGVRISKVEMEFASFSSGAQVTGVGVTFETGAVSAFEVDGLECAIHAPNAVYESPVGPFRTVVRCSAHAVPDDWRGSWSLRLRDDR